MGSGLAGGLTDPAAAAATETGDADPEAGPAEGCEFHRVLLPKTSEHRATHHLRPVTRREGDKSADLAQGARQKLLYDNAETMYRV
jgi:hypothetical protein